MEPTNQFLRVAAYIRVSSDEQAKFGDSLRDQTERTSEYVKGHSNMTLQDIYTDDGISGQKLDRGEFGRLIQAVETDQLDLIVFTKLDRWFRSLRHYLNTQAVLEEHQVAWIAIDQPYFDTSTPHGRAFVAQSMMWAELEAQNDGVRIKDVFANKVKYGEVITGKVPRGYQIENRHLTLSDQAPAIYDSIMYFLKTQSLHQTITYMREQHGIVMTLNNLKQSILRNSKYIGRYRGNFEYCPKLIAEEAFEQIQQILDRNINVRSSQRYPYIFSGLLVCSECGYQLSSCQINVTTKKNSGKTYRYRYPAYQCRRQRTTHTCANRGDIRELRVEEYMLEHVGNELNRYIAKFGSAEAMIVDNRDKKAKIRKKIRRLKDLYLNEAISLDEYKTDRSKYEAQLEDIPDLEEPNRSLSDIGKLLDCDFQQIYKELDNSERRRFWRSVIKEIRVSSSVNRIRSYEIIFL